MGNKSCAVLCSTTWCNTVLFRVQYNMTATSNGSATNTTAVTALSHQAQYCGPYKIEKTLGKGQTVPIDRLTNYVA
ncbi:unnamed protein product [Onchocerca flexuosa]|uniref:Secreted protein n=1 Tax=Onchocerca flexuosa TaxID=387005 RepID=A0A183GY92_9BILA|nr:unnamed protein product [Onchocerca flexuosa]